MTFEALFVPAAIRHAVSNAAWLQAMLDAERALAAAEAEAGVISPEASAAIAQACRPTSSTWQIAADGRAVANLIAARLATGRPLLFEVDDVRVEDVTSERRRLRYRHGGAEQGWNAT